MTRARVQACQKNIYLSHSELRAQHYDFAATVAIDVGRGDLIIAADRPCGRGCAGGKLGIGRQKPPEYSEVQESPGN